MRRTILLQDMQWVKGRPLLILLHASVLPSVPGTLCDLYSRFETFSGSPRRNCLLLLHLNYQVAQP